jgi:hypothetical protein
MHCCQHSDVNGVRNTCTAACTAACRMQVLQEALDNEDDARHTPTVDQLGPEAAVLLEELRERQVSIDLLTHGMIGACAPFDVLCMPCSSSLGKTGSRDRSAGGAEGEAGAC